MPGQEYDGTMGAEAIDHLVPIFARNVVIPFLIGPGRVRQSMDPFIVSEIKLLEANDGPRITRDLKPRLRVISVLLVLEFGQALAKQVQLDVGEVADFFADWSRLYSWSALWIRVVTPNVN